MLLILFFLILLGYSFFSYSLVDPNLVLTSNSVYWNFQQVMWSTFFSNGKLMAYVYFAIIIALFILYSHILEKLKVEKISIKNIFKSKYLMIFLLIIFPLLFSYNALSHDIFNYVFNAKMIVEYGADPHISVALDFPTDEWTRFMHNTHTPAPYGRGWTYLSLIPYMLGFGKLTLSLLSFRVWGLLSVVLLYLALQNFSKTIRKRSMNLYELTLVFLNPLLLIEVVSNYHNDLWMMSLAVLAISFLLKSVSGTKIKNNFLALSIVFLSISVSIKLASLALVPIWAFAVGAKFKSHRFFEILLEKFIVYIPDFAALLMMLPLFTVRSQQFLPWYILWVFVWIPFMKIKIFRNLIIVFTLSSSLRYLPWLANNLQFTEDIIRSQKLITWMIPGIYLFMNFRKIKR